MRKIFSFLTTTIDGYDQGPSREFDFWNLSEDFFEYSVEQLNEVDTLVLGRVTYEAMASYWPSAQAKQDSPTIAAMMNGISKIVVSRTLGTPEWANTRVIPAPDELTELKRQPGKDIAIFGSSTLTVSLLTTELVDELRVMVHPVILGAGRSVFQGAAETIHPQLIRVRPFDSGNVLLYYRPGYGHDMPQVP